MQRSGDSAEEKDWRRSVGMFDDDPIMKEIIEEGQRLREEDRKQRVGIGTMDLKIAAIALVNDATLLSSNLGDFRKVPGLRVEDWLAG